MTLLPSLPCFRVVLATALLAVQPAPAAEPWPEFRGPNRQGHATGPIPQQWSRTNNVAWKTPVPGQGWSSPVYGNGRVYLTTAVKDSAISLRALCLGAADGKNLWNTEVFAPGSVTSIHGKNSHASPTPVLEGDRLYVHFGHQGTAALDLSGKIVWTNAEHAYSPVHGNGGSPAIVGDALIFSADGAADPAVIALDKKTGKTLWKVPRKTDSKRTFSFSTPLLIEVNGRQELISPGSGIVSGLNPRTGAELWRIGYGAGYSVVPRPVFGHGLLFIGTGYDRPNVLAIRPGGDGDVTSTHVAWTLTKGAPNTPSLLLVGDELYMVSDGGIASCADARTGKVHWSERVGGNYSSSPLFADGRIYLQNEEGLATVLAPGREFRVLAKNDLGERTLASYAVAEKSLFIRTADHLWRISDPSQGK